MAKKKEETPSDWDGIEIGDQVKHEKWGVGTVLFRAGSGESAKAIVVFPEEGQKKLMLKYAGLVKVGTTSLKSVEKLKAESAPTPPRRKAAAPPAEPADDEEVSLDVEEGRDEEIFEDEEDVVGFDDEDDEFGGPDEGESE